MYTFYKKLKWLMLSYFGFFFTTYLKTYHVFFRFLNSSPNRKSRSSLEPGFLNEVPDFPNGAPGFLNWVPGFPNGIPRSRMGYSVSDSLVVKKLLVLLEKASSD